MHVNLQFYIVIDFLHISFNLNFNLINLINQSIRITFNFSIPLIFFTSVFSAPLLHRRSSVSPIIRLIRMTSILVFDHHYFFKWFLWWLWFKLWWWFLSASPIIKSIRIRIIFVLIIVNYKSGWLELWLLCLITMI